jgi:eukaryotic-like serine/threonine-protein kinase
MGLNPGTKLGPYEVVAALGAGGMGEVYRATDTRLGRDVAIKVLPASFANDEDRLRRFELEARTIAALNHPNIMGLHDIGTYEGSPFLVSELLEGETLRQKIEQGPIPTRRAVEYALGIAHGLAAAHNKDIVHRDLKPENVFITRDGRVKILDFGLAKLVRPEHSMETAMTLTSPTTMPGMVMGTVGYMSPEQVRGEPSDARSDIFSFGTVLYEMLTGKRAFKKDTVAETMTAILREEPPELPETGWQGPIGLQRILSRCLEKSPERRFQSASDLAFAIEALSGTGATHSVPFEAVKDGGSARRWVSWALGGLLCAAVGAAIAWGLRPGPRPVPTFERMSFERGTLVRGRFLSEGKTIVYSGVLKEGVPETYVIREDYLTSVPAGLNGAMVLAISKQDQLAVLVRPRWYGQYQWSGTLARVPMGGTAPRELLDNVYDAGWSPDGNELAVIHRKDDQWRVEYPIGKVLLETQNWLSDIRVSPDGKYVAVFQHPAGSLDDRGNVLLLDREGKQKVISSEWEALEGIAWTPNGKEVWYGAAETGDAFCVRASDLKGGERIVYCGTTGTRLHDIAANGKALVSSDVLRLLMTGVAHGSKDEKDLVTLAQLLSPKLTPDGSVLVGTDASEQGGKNYSVYAQKMDGSAPVKIGGGGYATDISDDGKLVLVVMPGEGRMQMVPMGAGETQTIEWNGFQVSWANWFPDGEHILLFGNPTGQPVGLYMTDRKGAAPKMLVKEAPTWADVMPDGEHLVLLVDGTLVQKSIADGTEKKLRKLEAGEVPVDWAKGGRQLFTQTTSSTTIRIDKVELDGEKRETWNEFVPKDVEGSMMNVRQATITPDGKRMVFDYVVHLGQFYVSENLR